MTTVHQLLADHASSVSSAVFVYDSTVSAPFGGNLESTSTPATAQLFKMQTRPGAGSALVGYVESLAFSSKGAHVDATAEAEEEAEAVSVPAKRSSRSTRSAAQSSTSNKKSKTVPAATKAISVLGSTASFKALVPALLSLPDAAVRSPLSIHISSQSSSLTPDAANGEPSLVQIPDLESLFEGIKALDSASSGFSGAIVLSSTAEQAAFVGTALATGFSHDLVNVFDGLTAGRQVSTIEASSPVVEAGDSVDAALVKAKIPYFEVFGSATAKDVVVLPASVYSANAKAALAAGGNDVAIVEVRVVKPWNKDAFLSVLPKSAKTLHVFTVEGQKTGVFHDEILSTLLSSPHGLRLKVKSLALPTLSSVPSVSDFSSLLSTLAPSTTSHSLLSEKSKVAVFWSLDASSSETELVPSKLAVAFADPATGVNAKLLTSFDNFSQGGIQQDLLLLESAAEAKSDLPVSAIAATTPASLLFISSPAAIFKAYSPINSSSIGSNTNLVISSNWTAEELPTKLSAATKQSLVENKPSSFFLIDTDKLAASHSVSASQIAELVFWSLYLPSGISAKEIVNLLAGAPSFKTWDHKKLVEINSAVRNALVLVPVENSWVESEAMAVDTDGEVVVASLPTSIVPTAAGPNADRNFAEPVAETGSWHSIAKRLMYPEAYERIEDVESKMRPDLPEKNYLVTVTETRRLTPTVYDRNVFHIEFDLKGTGLKYAVGEALGIHGWNDAEEVLEFIKWYGLDPEAIVSVPSKDDGVEQRTIFQVFQQKLDIFGKPGKSFYETLSKFATNKEQERALRFIGAPEGSATFKKMSETDTVTYADLLRLFPSARPSVEELVREIEEIKPRHYSIASSQNFVGDSVHLLIVTVEWNDPKGTPRFGQCTRYLNSLKAGDKVMVSVKPSVMKLPASDLAPVVMAGLGTGAAPFRAFIQERAWQKEQGREIGASLYYFGSRHRSEEYLYGEEIEAYLSEGVVTHTGLAFSRDTDKKIYIQHKMNEDAELLAKSMAEGSFYLCGPTWPVPDVYEALTKAFVSQGRTLEAAQAHIEELKEAERYVLEVY